MFVGVCTSILKTFKKSLKNHQWFRILLFTFSRIYLLILCGDTELNLGPKDAKCLPLCHWNLNSIDEHDFAKVSALKVFNITK